MGTRFALMEEYNIYQQFLVEFGRASVNTDADLGEASRDTRILADPKRYQNGGTFRVHSYSYKMFKCNLIVYSSD